MIVCRKCSRRHPDGTDFCVCGAFLEFDGEHVADDGAPPAPPGSSAGAAGNRSGAAGTAGAADPRAPERGAPARARRPSRRRGPGSTPERPAEQTAEWGSVQAQLPDAPLAPASAEPVDVRPTMRIGDVACGRCGTPNPPTRQFCQHCGQELAAVAGRRRQPGPAVRRQAARRGGGRSRRTLAPAGDLDGPEPPGQRGAHAVARRAVRTLDAVPRRWHRRSARRHARLPRTMALDRHGVGPRSARRQPLRARSTSSPSRCESVDGGRRDRPVVFPLQEAGPDRRPPPQHVVGDALARSRRPRAGGAARGQRLPDGRSAPTRSCASRSPSRRTWPGSASSPAATTATRRAPTFFRPRVVELRWDDQCRYLARARHRRAVRARLRARRRRGDRGPRRRCPRRPRVAADRRHRRGRLRTRPVRLGAGPAGFSVGFAAISGLDFGSKSSRPGRSAGSREAGEGGLAAGAAEALGAELVDLRCRGRSRRRRSRSPRSPGTRRRRGRTRSACRARTATGRASRRGRRSSVVVASRRSTTRTVVPAAADARALQRERPARARRVLRADRRRLPRPSGG